MKVEHYCYTRVKYLDYCVFSKPNNLPNYAYKEIQEKILSITDSIDANLNRPKWVLIKTPEYIVWGVCCLNRILSDEYNCDYCGTPISGMFAIVLTEYDKDCRVPYDIGYFRKLYEQEVSRFWNMQESHLNLSYGFINGDFNYIRARQNSNLDKLNTDKFKCLSHGLVNTVDLISTALSIESVSLLIDNDTIGQATSIKGAFMNCVSSLVPYGMYDVKQLCPRCKKQVTSFTSSGVCLTCGEKERISEEVHKIEDDVMNKQLKRELDEANSKIQYLEYDLEEANKKIKKQSLLNKILIALIALLFLYLSFAFCDTSSWGLLKKSYTNESKTEFLIPDTYQSSTLFTREEINVVRGIETELEIEYNGTQGNVEFSCNVDWVKIISTTPSLRVNVLPYSSEGRREAQIIAIYGQQKDTLTITQF